MTNKEKAQEIANKNRKFYGEHNCEIDLEDYSTKECFKSAVDMAQWKDEQICQFFNFVRPYLPAHIVAEAKKMLNIKH